MAGVPAHNHHQTFEGIKLLDDDGSEFWFARELAPLLDYPHWHNFARLIEKAKLACQRSGQEVADHFYETVKLVELGSGAERRDAPQGWRQGTPDHCRDWRHHA